jgi:hypothetical protein
MVPPGRSMELYRAGGRHITLVASSKLFHLPQDRLPHAMDTAAVDRSATAVSRVASALPR